VAWLGAAGHGEAWLGEAGQGVAWVVKKRRKDK